MTFAPKQETYFGGQYRQFLQMPSGVGMWSRAQSPDSGTWGFEASYTTPTYSFTFTSHNEEVGAIKRAVGGLIMAALPDAVLDQALASLRDYYLFYLEDQQLETVGGDLALAAGEDDDHQGEYAIGYSVDH